MIASTMEQVLYLLSIDTVSFMQSSGYPSKLAIQYIMGYYFSRPLLHRSGCVYRSQFERGDHLKLG